MLGGFLMFIILAIFGGVGHMLGGESGMYFGFLLLSIIVLIGSLQGQSDRNEQKEINTKVHKNNLEKLKEEFGSIKEFILNNDQYMVVSQKGEIMEYDFCFQNLTRKIDIKDVLGVKIFNDGQLLNTLQRGAVGAVLFGGVGLAAGMLTGRRKKLKVLLSVNDFDNPEWILEFNENEEKMESFLTILKVIEKNIIKES